MAEPSQTGRDETEEERLDRNLLELLNELRVALPGVQVLFAFLLVVPFNQRFAEITTFQERVYFVTLLLTAVASALLIAPSVQHRIEFRQGDKKQVVMSGNRLTIAGLAFLALGMTGAVLLITDLLFESTAMVAGVTAGVALVFAFYWYAMPLSRRLRS